MSNSRRDGLYLLLLGILTFVLFGLSFEQFSRDAMLDFKEQYFTARCLLLGEDPYDPADVSRVYLSDGIDQTNDSSGMRTVITHYIYMPTAFPITVPFALLAFNPAHWVWMLLNIGCLIVAACLVWATAAEFAPVLSGALIGFLLANDVLVVVSGNIVGIVIGFCVVGVWCICNRRFEAIGVACLAIALDLKPHDAGLLWLFLLFASKEARKRALQALALAVVLAIPAIVWVSSIAPHWLSEIRNNLNTYNAHGGLTDPGPSSGGVRILLVNLQTVFSTFRDDPHFYNSVSYGLISILVVLLSIVALRRPPSTGFLWLTMAAVSALTLLPVYHRRDDALLLMLCVPACARLWAGERKTGRIAVMLTILCLVASGDVLWPVAATLIASLHSAYTHQFIPVLQVFPAPCALLALGVFYLWICAKSAHSEIGVNDTASFKLDS